MKIFITGSNGFVGSYLIRRLEELHTIIKCDLPKCNITNLGNMIEMIDGNVDIVIHLAARVHAGQSIEMPRAYMMTNVMGLLNILEVMRIKKIPRIIFISSIMSKYYKQNGIPYQWTKKFGEMLIELYAKAYGIKAVILRPTNIYGIGNNKGVVDLFMKLKKDGKKLQIHGDGSQTRDFIHISDVIEAIVKSVEIKKLPKMPVYVEVGTGIETSILELAKMVEVEYVLYPEKVGGTERIVANISTGKRIKWKAKKSLKEWLSTSE